MSQLGEIYQLLHGKCAMTCQLFYIFVPIPYSLLNLPHLLCSGLDSESAYQLMKFLKAYVNEAKGRRVILTIHQPSSIIWSLIDNVVLLSKGHLVYQGPRQNIEEFFAHYITKL